MEEKKNDAVKTKHELFGSNFKCQRLDCMSRFLDLLSFC